MDIEAQLLEFKSHLTDEFQSKCSTAMGYMLLDIDNNDIIGFMSLDAKIGNFELQGVLPSPKITRLKYKYVENKEKHFEYIHNFLRELNKLVPTKDEIRHNITINEETAKLQISIYSMGGWDVFDMDETYEDNANYQELAKGISEMLK